MSVFVYGREREHVDASRNQMGDFERKLNGAFVVFQNDTAC